MPDGKSGRAALGPSGCAGHVAAHTSDLGRLESAFEKARELHEPERAAYLAELERLDGRLASEVTALLACDEEIGALDLLAERLCSVRGMIEREAASLADPHASPPPIPQHAGPYLITREIGRGAIGIVCLARDTRLGRDVALKIFPLPADGDEADGRMLAEARAASALDHPHICTIHDVGTLEDGRPYLAMAHYAGGTLAERIAKGPLTVRDAVHVALQLAHALGCAHAAGIVHRDLKPRNIAFAERGVTKLLDFGVATFRDGAMQGASAGTPAYMAPEQVRGEGVDGRADVWALGVVLYEMLTGRRPFVASNRAAIRRAILFDTPAPVRTLRREVPRKVAALLARMLDRSRAGRPDAATVARELRGLLAALDDARPRPFAWLHRHRGALAILFTGFVAASGAPVTRDARDARHDRARALLEAGEAEDVEAAIALLRGVVTERPRHAGARVQLARAYLRSAQPGMQREWQARWADSAITHARAALALAPADARAHTTLGMVYAFQGRHEASASAHRRALRFAPRSAESLLHLSNAYMALDRFGDAFVAMERALAIDPAVRGGRLRAAARYASWQLAAPARRHIAAGLRASPTDTELMWQRVMLELREGDTTAAQRQFEQYLTLVPVHEQLRLSAWFAYLRGDLAAARGFVDRVAGVGSASYDVRLYGEVYLRTGDRARGEAMLRAQLAVLRAEDERLGGRNEHVPLSLAHLHALLGERDAALRALERWDALGGIASRRQLAEMRGTWGELVSDARFLAVLTRVERRHAVAQARIVDRLRDEGLAPGA